MTNPKLRRGRRSKIGAIYAVTTVCKDRLPLFATPDLAQVAANELAAATSAQAVETHAWVIMPDHVHWLFQLRFGEIGQHMRTFKSHAAIAINRIRGRQGPIWQSGYYDHRLRSEDDLLMQARYIVANPLRAGLVQRIEDYPYWSCDWVKTTADLFL